MSQAEIPPGVDPTRPSSGRMYDYYLGGTENLPVDREAVQRMLDLGLDLSDMAWANRGFLQRAASWMAAEHGIDQFIDLGAGLPTQNNTHEAVQAIRPTARVAYVDNDPMILAHAQSLLEGTEHVVYISGDFREPDKTLNHPEVRELIDFSRPVGLMCVALLHFVKDSEQPRALISTYLDAVPSGSFLAISHATADQLIPAAESGSVQAYSNSTAQMNFRSKQEVTGLFDGLEIVPPYPGAVPEPTWLGLWAAEDPDAADSEGGRLGYCAVGRKP
ncbi:SAM-dependent methyltransferase [Flindersiella endophytica]